MGIMDSEEVNFITTDKGSSWLFLSLLIKGDKIRDGKLQAF